MKRIQYFGLVFSIILTWVQPPSAQDPMQQNEVVKQDELKSGDDAESLFELLKEIKSNEVGDFGGNPFGPQFNFHPKETIAKTVAKFDKIKAEARFQEILLKKLKKPREFFAAYQILNGSHDRKHRINLLKDIVLKSGDIGWVTSITVGVEKQEVTIGEVAIRAILSDHWTQQFHTMNMEARARKSKEPDSAQKTAPDR